MTQLMTYLRGSNGIISSRIKYKLFDQEEEVKEINKNVGLLQVVLGIRIRHNRWDDSQEDRS